MKENPTKERRMGDHSYDSMIEEGNAAFSARRFDEAIARYTAAIDSLKEEMMPTSSSAAEESDIESLRKSLARALSNRSGAFSKLEKYAEALTDATDALTFDASYFKAHGRRGAALQGLLRFEEAIEAYRKALQCDARNATYLEAVSELQTLLQQGRGVASESTKERYYFDKSVADGKKAMQSGELHEAVRHFTRALQCDHSSSTQTHNASLLKVPARDRAVLLCNRSAAFYRLSKFTESRTDAAEAVEVDGLYARGHLRLAMACHRLGLLDEAVATVKRSIELDGGENAMAADELKSIEASIKERATTTTERMASERQRVEDIKHQRATSGAADDNGIGALRRFAAGPAHATQFAYCNVCNSHGHDRSECPMLMRSRMMSSSTKRPRE